MIINRAMPDLSEIDYTNEIKKMVELRNENGHLFNE